MKYKIAAFFAGRNGMDDLSGIIVWPSLIIMLLSGFISTQWPRTALYWVVLCSYHLCLLPCLLQEAG